MNSVFHPPGGKSALQSAVRGVGCLGRSGRAESSAETRERAPTEGLLEAGIQQWWVDVQQRGQQQRASPATSKELSQMSQPDNSGRSTQNRTPVWMCNVTCLSWIHDNVFNHHHVLGITCCVSSSLFAGFFCQRFGCLRETSAW